MQPTWIEIQAQGIDRILDHHGGMTGVADRPELTAGKNKIGFWVRYKGGGWEMTIAGKHSLGEALEELGRRLQ